MMRFISTSKSPDFWWRFTGLSLMSHGNTHRPSARLEASQPNERAGELEYEPVQFGRAVMFHALGLMDGVGDPSLTPESWGGLKFEHRSEGAPMLHDAFMEALSTYEGLFPGGSGADH